MATLTQKLQLKDGQQLILLNTPQPMLATFQAALPTIQIETVLTPSADALFLFATNSDDLRHFIQAEPHLKKDALIWIAYPKKSSGIDTDLTRDHGWRGISDRWRGVRQIAIDAKWSALRFKPKSSEADLLAAQYAKKVGIRPIFDQLAAELLGWADVTQAVRNKYVAFVHHKQFARIHPSTKTRIDLVLALKGEPVTARLEAAGRIGDSSFTHKIILTSADQIDDQLLGWIRKAYNRR